MALTKISTDGVKDDAITKTKIPANQIEASELADNAVDTNAIANDAVTVSKIQNVAQDRILGRQSSGTGDLQELNAGNVRLMLNVADGANQTTINNNADNRVITGSGTANTLEGESNLTFDGTKLSLTPPANTGNDGLEIIPAGGSTASSFKVKGNQSAGLAAGRNGGVVEIDANYYAATSDIFTIKSRGSTVLNMYGNGNLGLGTASPNSKLHVKGSGEILRLETTATTGSNYINFNDADENKAFIGLGSGSDDSLSITLVKSSNLRFATSNTERMRIDSSGRLLINTTNNSNGHIAASNLAVQGADLSIFKDSGGDNPNVSGHKLKFVTQSGSLGEIDVFSEGAGGPSGRGGIMRFYTKQNNVGAAAERMRINSVGHVFFSEMTDLTASSTNKGVNIQNSTNNGRINLHANSSAGTAHGILFYHSGSNVGQINYGSSSTSYNTQSDYRLKENVVAISDGITRLKTLKPSRFNFKIDKDTTVDGFLAHEVTAVPEAIHGTKDEVATEDDENRGVKKGDPIYQGIDQSKLVPLLTAALQEAVGKIEVLETKVAALEAA